MDGHTIKASDVLEAWFRGEVGDEELISQFLPTADLSPLERIRTLAQCLNLAGQMAELTEYAIIREAERTAEAIGQLSDDHSGVPMVEATKFALEEHFDALQLMVQACQESDPERIIEALEIAARAESAMSAARAATTVAQEHCRLVYSDEGL